MIYMLGDGPSNWNEEEQEIISGNGYITSRVEGDGFISNFETGDGTITELVTAVGLIDETQEP